jgi:hypothetical protein
MGPISFACVQSYKTRNDVDDRHTCACLFIVVVHQLNRSLLTLFLLLNFGLFVTFISRISKLLFILIRYHFSKKKMFI